MRHTFFKTFWLITAAAAFGSVACSTMTEKEREEREEREYARVEWQEQFRTDRRVCLARGGNFVFDGVAELDRYDVPKTRVFCACS
jgi:hypothetical protein